MIEDLVQQLSLDVERLIGYIENHAYLISGDALELSVAEQLKEMTTSIHERCELICRDLCAFSHEREMVVKLAVGRISGFVFFAVDEFVYAKFSTLAPKGLISEKSNGSTNHLGEIDINALKRLLAEELSRLWSAIGAPSKAQ